MTEPTNVPHHHTYDTVPYPSLPNRRSHPSHVGAIARLFDLPAAAVTNCRVLELGCAAGGNLLPLAEAYPQSQFVGVDTSAGQIFKGQEIVTALNLRNISLRQQDILDLAEDQGPFDYILCHGVFSWVPRAVQDHILRVCRLLLSHSGVAYISYNTYPGWHLRAIVRDMMRYHVRNQRDPDQQIQQARVLLDFLVDHAAGNSQAYRQILQNEAQVLREHADAYLFHEHLEDVNEPFYFHEFVDRVHCGGLQYLGDTEFSTMLPGEFGDEVASLLKPASFDVQEQYMDFLRNRTFRGSLLCHAERTIDRDVPCARLYQLDVLLDGCEQMPQAVMPPAGEPLVVQVGAETIRAKAPITQAALIELLQALPAPVPFDTLWRASAARLGAAASERESSRVILAEDLLHLFARRMIRLELDAAPCSSRPGPTPSASSLARWQASRGSVVTTRRHESVRLSEISRRVLGMLNGRRDEESLTGLLTALLRSGEVALQRDGHAVEGPSGELAAQAVKQALCTLAQEALLTG